jgi:uncharacterized protein YifE (UPF0438 family)
MCIEDFASGHKFYDSKNYSMSFRRSGDFSIKESDILERCGFVISQLMEGKRAPENPAQEKIIEVIKGSLPGDSVVEKAWLKYMNLIQHPKYVTFLSSTNRDSDDVEEDDDDFDTDD